MANLRKTIARIKKFDFEKALLKVVKDNDNVAIDLNTDDQLFAQGIDAKGNLLPGPYAPFTIEIKTLKGQPTDRITLRYTGDFHDGFFLSTNSFPLVMDSRDSKTAELKQEWGEDIFGLTEDSQDEFNKQILPDLQSELRRGIL